MKNKIGVYTLYNNYNYGSVLQCYAFQQVLKKMGYDAFVINPIPTGVKKNVDKIIHAVEMILKLLRYPSLRKEMKRYFKESKRSVRQMDEISKAKFKMFIGDHISVMDIDTNDIKKFARNDEVVAFIAGSDQVWSVSSPYLNPYGFLFFAPESKRFSYAASFGADFCPPWHINRLRKLLSKFRSISVREKMSVELANQLGCNKVYRHVDPVFLLSPAEWSTIMDNTDYTDYSFAFFLNEPSEIAIEHIINYSKGENIVYGPYRSSKLDSIGCKYIVFSPNEFLSLIHKANTIFTDSFHATAFSIVFERDFFVYMRNYQHSMTQNNRITSLLDTFNLSTRLILDNCQKSEKCCFNKNIINSECVQANEYLQIILKELTEGKGNGNGL
jgi:hypothetical protein